MKKLYKNLEQKYFRLGDFFTFQKFIYEWLERSYIYIGSTKSKFLKMDECNIPDFCEQIFKNVYGSGYGHKVRYFNVVTINPKTGGYQSKYKICVLQLIERPSDTFLEKITMFFEKM